MSSGSAWPWACRWALLSAAHGFRIRELLTPADIQQNIIDAAGAELTAFEHVNYCLAAREN